jgi:dihydrofolate reductase
VREVVLQLHTTLDGLADSRDGFVPISDRAYWKALGNALAQTGAATVDTLLMGRGTYRQFVQFWPKVATDPAAPKDWKAQAKFLNDTPKVVFSKTLPRVEWPNSTLVRGDVAREIARLRRLPGKNLLVPGGVEFPRALIERDLVDEYLLSIVPVVVGERGNRLFGALPRPRRLRHLRSWTFPNGVVLQRYRRIGGRRRSR